MLFTQIGLVAQSSNLTSNSDNLPSRGLITSTATLQDPFMSAPLTIVPVRCRCKLVVRY